MSAAIYLSSKFDHSREQYFAVANGYTLLRLTLGSIDGRRGGAIKTATASDFGASPIYPHVETLVSAMRSGINNLGGKDVELCIDIDGKGRPFAQVRLPGSRELLLEAFTLLAEEMGAYLAEPKHHSPFTASGDLSDLYDDLCITEGEPVYLSDGVYLGPDGHLIQ